LGWYLSRISLRSCGRLAVFGYFKGKTEIAMAIAAERHAMERRRIEFALAAPDIDTSLRRLVEGFVLELRAPKERHLDPPSAARVMVAVLQCISLQLAWGGRVDIERFAVALRIMLDPRSDGSGATG
jgi:TetR/AcrR family transcriptional regulator, transcriptional repressor of aconitase